MSFRRFLYLVAEDAVDCSYSLRRIDMSRLFRPFTPGETLDGGGGAAGATALSAIPDAGPLPEPMISLCGPRKKNSPGLMDFMLFKNTGTSGQLQLGKHKVVGMDRITGRAVMCDPDVPPSIRALPSVTTPKHVGPLYLTAGDGRLYIMNLLPVPANGCNRHSFEVLSYDDDISLAYKDWCWHPLPPPTYVYGPRDPGHLVESHALAAGGEGILVSNKAGHTYRYDTATRAWAKAGDWAMPFWGLAEHVPEHGGLLFGLSTLGNGYRFCAASVAAAAGGDPDTPPAVRGAWREYVPSLGWKLVWSDAVHLGSSRFCLVRFFEIVNERICPKSRRPYDSIDDYQVVLTGVEVKSHGGEGLHVVKHKSELYKLDLRATYQVL
ncbi:hypothetical protein ACP4OV_018605 [Aristida adscensionis]